MTSESAPKPTVRPPRATRIRRWALGLGLVLAVLMGLRIGWGFALDEVRHWFSAQHGVGRWSWKLWGARREGFSVFELDSAVVRGPTIHLRLRSLRVEIAYGASAYPVPSAISLRARRLDLLPIASPKPDTSAPAFPDLALPLALHAELDTLVIRAQALDTGKVLASVRGIQLESEGPRRIVLGVHAAESPVVQAFVQATLAAEWTESDTLRLRLSAVASSGCCASDTLSADASLLRSNLRLGRARIKGRIEESRGWSEALPALAKAPALHAIGFDLSTSADRRGRRLHAAARLSTDSLAVLPPMDWNVEADLAPLSAKLRVVGALPGSEESSLDIALSGTIPKTKSLDAIEATGEAAIRGLGMPINGFDHPFDSDVKILSLDRRGARVELTTAAGSRIQGQSQWKGMHWTLDGDIVAGEPWAMAWTDSLHLDGGARAHGQDSAGTALFDVVARHPRIRMVRLDSLSTHLRIALPGPRLTFSGIEARDSSRTWTGKGNISIPDSIVHFELSRAGDSSSLARLDVKIGGGVLIQAHDFPTQGLPLRLSGLPAFPMRVDAEFRRDAAVAGIAPVSLVTATARAKPYQDSIHAFLEMSLADSLLRIERMRMAVGGSSVDGGLVLRLTESGWTLDTLRATTARLDLPDLRGLVPGFPDLRGHLSGHVLSQRGQGVSADLRLSAPAIAKQEGDVLLPDLLLWGERDTLHLGGWWPLAGSRAPFRLTATHLWDPDPEFSLLAFWGDVVRLRADGVFQDKRSLRTKFMLDGSAAIPGTEARLRDLLVEGRFDGEAGAKGFAWKAVAEGKKGELQALAGNPLELRFHAQADPAEIRLSDASLGGAENGTLRAQGRYDLALGKFALAGHASALHFDLGSGKRIELDSLVVAATPDSRILMDVLGTSWHQEWNRSERMDVRVPEAKLTFALARDWKKLSGDITVDKLLFTRNFADPKALWNAARQVFGSRRKSSSGASASSPLLLDLRVSSLGDSIRLADNLGQARLGFDLQVAGPSEAPLLNGFMAADTEGGHFGYARRDFHIDTLRMDWNTQPVSQGQFQLAGFRNIRKTCQDQNSTSSTVSTIVDSCQLRLSAQGTLDQPRLKSITSDCATQPGDDGTVGATIALAAGCYPQQSGNSNFGSTLENAGKDMLLDLGKDQVNEFMANGLRDSRESLVWVPDSVAVTDLSGLSGSGRNQLGLMALYHITPELDAAGIYQHTFTQTTSTLGSKVLSDNYGLSLRYHIPFHWVEDTATRQRLENRVFFQFDIGEALDDNSQRQMVYQPSLRYRWEFW